MKPPGSGCQMSQLIPDSLKGTKGEVSPEFDVHTQLMSNSPGLGKWVGLRNTKAVMIQDQLVLTCSFRLKSSENQSTQTCTSCLNHLLEHKLVKFWTLHNWAQKTSTNRGLSQSIELFIFLKTVADLTGFKGEIRTFSANLSRTKEVKNKVGRQKRHSTV